MLVEETDILRSIPRSIARTLAKVWYPPWLLRRTVGDYDFISKLFHEYQVGILPGDVLELGSWLGFGTAKLAALAGPSGKVVHTSDLFPVQFGSTTRSPYGTVRRYDNLYRGLTQRQVFDRNTAGHSNIEVHVGNVMDLTFPSAQRFVCSLIDSDHSYEAVCRCLELVWPHTTPGGLTFLSSYGNPDYPGVKKAADEFIAANSDDILSVRRKRQRRIIMVMKSPERE